MACLRLPQGLMRRPVPVRVPARLQRPREQPRPVQNEDAGRAQRPRRVRRQRARVRRARVRERRAQAPEKAPEKVPEQVPMQHAAQPAEGQGAQAGQGGVRAWAQMAAAAA
jgi:hypothetical protein